mgnify:CR=1 FL=1
MMKDHEVELIEISDENISLVNKFSQFESRRAFQRNNKIVCIATTKFIAHLINQRVLTDFFGLE